MFSFALLLAAAGAADPVLGVWNNPDKSLTVRTYRCGPQLCATVIAATERAKTRAAKAGVAPLVGTELMSHYLPDGEGNWAGSVLIPSKGRRFASTLAGQDGRTLKLAGCLFAGFLCKTEIWTRAERTAEH